MAALNINIPGPWQFLTDQQLSYTFQLLAAEYSAIEVKTLFLLHFGGITVQTKVGNSFVIKHEDKSFSVTAQQIAEVLSSLRWLDSLPGFPTRISELKGHKALPADFQEVPFEKYLYLDNLYQGYLHSQKEDLLNEMGNILYDCEDIQFSKDEQVNIFYWYSSLKSYLSSHFRNFFTPASGLDKESSQSLRDTLMESMNAQIRALTGGDITKEKEVLAMDTWRALTELNAKARDAEEIKTRYK